MSQKFSDEIRHEQPYTLTKNTLTLTPYPLWNSKAISTWKAQFTEDTDCDRTNTDLIDKSGIRKI